MDRFSDKPVYAVSTSDAIRKTRAMIESALAEAEEVKAVAAAPTAAPVTPATSPPPDASKFLLPAPTAALVALDLQLDFGGEFQMPGMRAGIGRLEAVAQRGRERPAQRVVAAGGR